MKEDASNFRRNFVKLRSPTGLTLWVPAGVSVRQKNSVECRFSILWEQKKKVSADAVGCSLAFNMDMGCYIAPV